MAPEIHAQQDTNVGASLPFSGLDELKFGHVISGSRRRNYLAGHTKKSLRLRPNHLSDLKAFVDLPVELQLLVLEHLHPIDLYHFSRLSKYFRQLVLDPAALSVWKTAFMRHPDLPKPPLSVNEPEWAFMIYGPGICGVCGKYGALTDFGLRKRFCRPCLTTHTLPLRGFRDESNKAIPSNHVIWELIPCTDRYKYSARYLKTDFSTMWKKLELIRILYMNGLRLLSPLITDYITTRKDYIQRLNNSVQKFNNWAASIFQRPNHGDGLTHHLLATKCETRLRALGYEEWDILCASDSIRHLLREKAIYRLTRRTLREIRPRIEVFLRRWQIQRIKNERCRLLLQIYRDYLKTRSPDEWLYLPDVDAQSILDTELFQKLLRAPSDESVNITPGSVVPFLSESIEKWIMARREAFAKIHLQNPDETLEARVQRLELVTSVVTCRTCADGCRPLIGWKSVCRHELNSKESCRRYVIRNHAVAAATSLVSSIGLDPLTTTVDHMNHRNDRFVCGNCSPEVRRGRLSRRVYTWLECLEHAIAYDGSTAHAKPVWLPLSPAAVRFVRGHEKPYPDPSIPVWRCNLCAHHFEEQVLQADAIDHVKKVHCIRIPAIGVDVVADPRKRVLKRRQVFRLSVDPTCDHICKRCPDIPIFKLWEKGILMHHLIKRHHVLEPTEHVDWESVPIIALHANIGT